MSFQYALRFESGERSGEVVPVTIVAANKSSQNAGQNGPLGGVFTIGRKPGNSLQIADPSVSGRHAELELAGENLSIRDLESTNGTEVSGRRVTDAIVSHGDEITLGKVHFTLVDQTRASAALRAATSNGDAAAGVAAGPDGLAETRIEPRDEAIEITAADLERSKRSSKLVPLVVGALALVAVGVWWWQSQAEGDTRSEARTRDVAPVVAPDGNVLADGYSFESSGGWILETEDATSPFILTRAGAATGRRGALVELEPGGRAILEHEPVRASGSMRLSAQVRATSDARARIGVRFLTDGDGDAGGTIWSAPALGFPSNAAGAGEFTALEMLVRPPSGVELVQVVLEGASTLSESPDGERAMEEADTEDVELAGVAFDDVALVPVGSTGALHTVASWKVEPIAASADWSAPFALAVTSLDEAPVPMLSFRTRDDEPFAASVSSSDDDAIVRLSGGANASTSFMLRVDQSLASQGIATLKGDAESDASTYASHGGSFDRGGVTSLLVGREADLLRLVFGAPVALRARTTGEDVVFQGELGDAESLTLQFDFMSERAAAQSLARRAREQRSKGRSFEALQTWREMMRDVPFQHDLVEEAARAEAEITAEGRRELEALTAEVDRARFFALEDIYLEKLVRVNDLAGRYRGSDVEPAAQALAETIEAELESFGQDSREHEARRLEAIESALAREGAEELSARVEAYRMNASKRTARGDAGEGEDS